MASTTASSSLTSAQKAASTIVPVWETSKENAAPMQRGRNVTTLERSVSMTDVERVETERRVAWFEEIVASTSTTMQTSNNNDSKATNYDDPLVAWLSYIKFYQEHHPADTHQHFLLLERCFRALYQQGRYANDARFIRVCCLYAEKTAEPCTTFTELYRLGIGHVCAVFWNAWAYVAERDENFALADSVFQKGLQHQAIPTDYLQLRHKRFQRRMTRYWINQSQQQEHSIDDISQSQQQQRGFLGSLSTTSTSTTFRIPHHQPSSLVSRPNSNGTAPVNATFVDRSSTAARVQSRSGERSNHGDKPAAFAIFVDSDNHAPSGNDAFFNSVETNANNPHRERETEAQRWKENRADAERWNERGYGLQQSATVQNASRLQGHGSVAARPPPRPLSSLSSASSFAIHVDDECAADDSRQQWEQSRNEAMHRGARDERMARNTATTVASLSSSLAFQEHEPSAMETLSHDPLRYIRHPELAAVAATARADEGTVSNSLATKTNATSNNGKTTTSGAIRPAWKNSLLKDASTGMEQCFEEARASAGYYTVLEMVRNVNRLRLQHGAADDEDAVNSSIMSISLEESEYTHEHIDAGNGPASGTGAGIFCDDTTPRHYAASAKKRIFSDRKRPPKAIAASVSRCDASFESATTAIGLGGDIPPIVLNGSMDSSTLDVSFAPKKEEQTINTQLALKELSMMFFSPAIGLGSGGTGMLGERTGGLGPILNESASSDLRNASLDEEGGNGGRGDAAAAGGDAAYSAPSQRHQAASSDGSSRSFVIHSDVVDAENETGMPRNLHARAVDFPGFDTAVLRPLTQETAADEPVLGCTNSRSRSRNSDAQQRPNIGPVGQDDHFQSLPVRDMPTHPGFSIFADDDSEQSASIRRRPSHIATTTAITHPPVEELVSPTGSDTAAFSQVEAIFRDLNVAEDIGQHGQFGRGTDSTAAGLGNRRESTGDTATYSMVAALDTILNDKPKDTRAAPSRVPRPPSGVGTSTFQIFEDNDTVTATLSPINDRALRMRQLGRSFRDDYTSEFAYGQSRSYGQTRLPADEPRSPTFGDISGIVCSDEPESASPT